MAETGQACLTGAYVDLKPAATSAQEKVRNYFYISFWSTPVSITLVNVSLIKDHDFLCELLMHAIASAVCEDHMSAP